MIHENEVSKRGVKMQAYQCTKMMLQRTHPIDPALAKPRSSVYDVGPFLNQHRRNVSCSPESNNR